MHERMMDRSTRPSEEDMVNRIGQPMAEEWVSLRRFLAGTYHIDPAFDAGGKRYGWNLKYRVGGRPLCEMYPEQGSFTVLVILGKNELRQAIDRIDTFGPLVRQAVEESHGFPDGCWMYIRVSDPLRGHQDVGDIEELLLIKRKPPRSKVPARERSRHAAAGADHDQRNGSRTSAATSSGCSPFSTRVSACCISGPRIASTSLEGIGWADSRIASMVSSSSSTVEGRVGR